MRIRMSCPGRPLRGCRVGDVQRAVVHVLVVAVRLSCVVLSVELVKRAALEIRERPFEPTLAVALVCRERPVNRTVAHWPGMRSRQTRRRLSTQDALE